MKKLIEKMDNFDSSIYLYLSIIVAILTIFMSNKAELFISALLLFVTYIVLKKDIKLKMI